MIDEIVELFFDLTKVSLGNKQSLTRVPSAREWSELYEIAKKQSLVGVCFASVQRLGANADDGFSAIGLPEILYFSWMGMAAKIQQRNEVVNQQCVDVQQLIEADGFRTYIMKGQGNAALYQCKLPMQSDAPKISSGIIDLSLLRQSGDIDIYLEGGFKKVVEFVQRTFPTKEINELEIHYHCLPDTDVEIHYQPFVMDSPKNAILQKFFSECKEANFANKISLGKAGEICVPTLEFNLVHQMAHIIHHFFYSGIGLRQLMDYYFLLISATNSNCKKEVVVSTIHKLGLDRFAAALMWVLMHVFGLKVEQALWAPCEMDGRMLLDEILQSGNFGHMDARVEGVRRSKWKSFWILYFKSIRLWRFDPWAWFWSPIYRIKGKVWQVVHGYR